MLGNIPALYRAAPRRWRRDNADRWVPCCSLAEDQAPRDVQTTIRDSHTLQRCWNRLHSVWQDFSPVFSYVEIIWKFCTLFHILFQPQHQRRAAENQLESLCSRHSSWCWSGQGRWFVPGNENIWWPDEQWREPYPPEDGARRHGDCKEPADPAWSVRAAGWRVWSPPAVWIYGLGWDTLCN